MQSSNSSTANTSQVSYQNIQNAPPVKRGRKQYTYQKIWERDRLFSEWVEQSTLGNLFFYCKICKVDRRCTAGKNNLTRHVSSPDHIKNSGQAIHLNKAKKTNADTSRLQNNMVVQGSMNQSDMNEVSSTPSTSTFQMPLGRPPLPVATNLSTDIIQQPTAYSFPDTKQEPREDIQQSEEIECSSTHPEEFYDVSKYCDVTLNCSNDTSPVTNISSVATTSSNQTDGLIKLGKIKMACFLAKHNLRLDITEDLKDLMQSVCSDLDIAKHLTLKETEAHSIISDVIGNVAQNVLINTLIKEKFSLIVEEIWDQSMKQLALIARTAVDFKVEDHFLNLIYIEEPCAFTLHHESIQQYFDREKIPYKENLIGLAAEATSSIFRNEILSPTAAIKDIPDLFLLKCIRNSFHMCASHACNILPAEFKLFVRSVIGYIQIKEFKRPQNLEHYHSYANEIHDIHFLSDITSIPFLLPLVKEMLDKFTYYTHQHAALYNTTVSSRSTHNQFNRTTTKLYLEFLRFILPYFDKVNMEMQSEVPKLYKLYKHVVKLQNEILFCFIKTELYVNIKVEEEQENKLLSLDYKSSENHLPLQNIYLGGNVATLLLQEEFIASPDEIRKFKEICKRFYIESIKQIRTRFGNKEMKKLKSLTFLNPEHLIKKESVNSIADLGIHFKGICPRDMTALDREWRVLRNIKSLCHYDPTIKVEEFWKNVSEMKEDNLKMFPLLSQFVRSLLALPHSSAANQRIISSLNKLAAPVPNRQTKMLHGFLHLQSLNNSFEPTEEHLKMFNKIFENSSF